MEESLCKTPVSTVGESKIRYMLVRWQPNSRDRPTTVRPRSFIFFLIAFPIWTDIGFHPLCTWKLPVNVHNTKKRGSLDLSLVWQPEAFACPSSQDEQRKTHARYVTFSSLPKHCWNTETVSKTYQDVSRYFDYWLDWKLRSFRSSTPKRKLRFINNTLHPRSSSKVRKWCAAKIQIVCLLLVVFSKKPPKTAL